MPEQGNLFTSRNQRTPATEPVAVHASRIPGWLAALELILFVILRFYVGALVVLLPWRPVWTTNAWINHWPVLVNFLAQGWVRGIVSGLGLLNIWIALTALFRRQRRY